MSEYFAIAVEGLSAIDVLDQVPPKILKTARIAVNATVRKAQKVGADAMRRQVYFPAGYLTGENARLKITKFATDSNLQGAITGRDRPTSLARFVLGGAKPGQRDSNGVSVQVKPGRARQLKSAFAIRLRNNNIGLAVRTKNGQPLRNSVGAKAMGNGLWLLYGPSVDQVFNKTREDIRPGLESFMESEFRRLIEVEL